MERHYRVSFPAVQPRSPVAQCSATDTGMRSPLALVLVSGSLALASCL
jgi:hypothetical protein